MTRKEKILYQQIHPLKLLVDVSTGLTTTYLAWHHDIFWFAVLFLIPSIIATVLVIKFADLERLKQSSFGKYVAGFMTPAIEAIRLAGQVIMWVAAWIHLPMIIAIGALIIIGGWLKGKLHRSISAK